MSFSNVMWPWSYVRYLLDSAGCWCGRTLHWNNHFLIAFSGLWYSTFKVILPLLGLSRNLFKRNLELKLVICYGIIVEGLIIGWLEWYRFGKWHGFYLTSKAHSKHQQYFVHLMYTRLQVQRCLSLSHHSHVHVEEGSTYQGTMSIFSLSIYGSNSNMMFEYHDNSWWFCLKCEFYFK